MRRIRAFLTKCLYNRRLNHFRCPYCRRVLDLVDPTWNEYIWKDVVAWLRCKSCKKRWVHTKSVDHPGYRDLL